MSIQKSVLSLPPDEQRLAMLQTRRAIERFPAVQLPTGERLHVFEMSEDVWEVWLNCEDVDFTGICVAVEKTRQEAVTHAVKVFEAALEELQKPPVRESARPCGCDHGANYKCERHSAVQS